MSAPASTHQQIAHEALDNLESAQHALSQLESLLYVALTEQCPSVHLRNLIDIGWHLACDGANTADCDREKLCHALAQAAAGEQ